MSFLEDDTDASFEAFLKEAAALPMRSSPHLLSGVTLAAGRYRIVRALGEGGMGVVYEVEDRQRGCTVALKTLARVDPAGIYRLKNEFRQLADVSHPNLCRLYELTHCDELWFFTMECVRGVRFDRAVYSGAALDEQRLRDALAQLCAGVSAVHSAGKLHKDLKPENVLVETEGRVVVLDFGLASDPQAGGVGQTVAEEHSFGTPAYMAPEQAAALPASRATDWYAVGVMLYEALTGELPFAGSSKQVLAAKQACAAPEIEDEALPADLRALCTRLLERDPQRRADGAQILAVVGGGLRSGQTTGAAVPSTRSAQPSSVSFVGRDEELAQLHAALAATDRGRAAVAYVHGLSGMGKTALCEHFLSQLREQTNAIVVSGRCYERESVPFKALDAVVDGLTRLLRQQPSDEVRAILPRGIHALTQVFPVLRRVEAIAKSPPGRHRDQHGSQLRRRAFIALKELLSALADRAPVVVFIDDLQWGDRDSVALLEEILGEPDPAPLLLVAAYRSDEAEPSPCLRELAEVDSRLVTTDLRRVEVGPLDEQAARRLAQALVGDGASAQRVEHIVRDSAGSPFFLGELGQRGAAPPQALDNVIATRVDGLEPPAARLLEVVAVAAGPLPEAVALEAASVGVESIATLGVARLARRLPDGRLEAWHDRVREGVVRGLAQARLRECHRRLASALQAVAGSEAELLVEHLAGAGERHRAGQLALKAAERSLEGLAFERAAQLYAQAMRWMDPAPAELLALQRKRARALEYAHCPGPAAEQYLEAAKGGVDDEVSVALRTRAAEQFLMCGRLGEAVAALGDLFEQLVPPLPTNRAEVNKALGEAWAALVERGFTYQVRQESEIPARQLRRVDLCWALVWGLNTVDARQLPYLMLHLHYALDAGELSRIVRGLAMYASMVVVLDPKDATLGEFLRMTEVAAAQVGDAVARGWVAWAHMNVAMWSGRRCRDEIQRVADEWSRASTPQTRGLHFLQHSATWAAWENGNIGELRPLVSRWMREAQAAGDAFGVSRLGAEPLLALANDEPERALRELELHERNWAPLRESLPRLDEYDWFEGLGVLHRWRISLYRGGAEAWEGYAKTRAELRATGYMRTPLYVAYERHFAAAAMLAAAAVAPQEHRTLCAEAESCLDAAEGSGFPIVDFYAAGHRAALADLRGDTSAALRYLEQALQRARGPDGNAMFEACVKHRQGELLGGPRGAGLIREAEAVLTAEGIVNPARWTSLILPGFAQRASA